MQTNKVDSPKIREKFIAHELPMAQIRENLLSHMWVFGSFTLLEKSAIQVLIMEKLAPTWT